MLTSLQIFQFHICWGLFDKLILPILTYGSEVSGFSKADNIERMHLQFCKHLLGVKIQTQNNFVLPRSHIHGLDAGLATDAIRHHSWQSVLVRSFPYCIRYQS